MSTVALTKVTKADGTVEKFVQVDKVGHYGYDLTHKAIE